MQINGDRFIFYLFKALCKLVVMFFTCFISNKTHILQSTSIKVFRTIQELAGKREINVYLISRTLWTKNFRLISLERVSRRPRRRSGIQQTKEAGLPCTPLGSFQSPHSFRSRQNLGPRVWTSAWVGLVFPKNKLGKGAGVTEAHSQHLGGGRGLLEPTN